MTTATDVPDAATDAVIVATARSPIGRAFKGSLVDMRPDDMAAQIVSKLLDKVPGLPHDEIEDLIMGTGSPGGEQGFNIGRATAVLAGLENVPGTTVNRYCSSSLQTIRMAAHAVRAGEGDAFIAAGVECVSRYTKGNADSLPDTTNPLFQAPGARTKVRAEGGQADWAPPAGMPDLYISMGETAENVAELKGVSREAMDEYGVMSQNKAEAAIERGFFELDITPLELPDGTVVSADDGPRPGVTLDGVSQLKPVFRPDGRVTAGNACPLNDGAAAVVVMSRKRAEELGIKPLARVLSSAVTGLNPEIMGLGPVEACKR
ncbi:MAG TPA: acetyl-CoA C-acyltransferase, partial [Acidimicrobiaceae bacterium]|nr:acetyl-CoA C-acyltransferase [Acidimicrobiaceae bacterium]